MFFGHVAAPSDGHNHGGGDAGGMEPHNLVGPPLVLGFLLMLIIDQFAGGHRKQGTLLKCWQDFLFNYICKKIFNLEEDFFGKYVRYR